MVRLRLSTVLFLEYGKFSKRSASITRLLDRQIRANPTFFLMCHLCACLISDPYSRISINSLRQDAASCPIFGFGPVWRQLCKLTDLLLQSCWGLRRGTVKSFCLSHQKDGLRICADGVWRVCLTLNVAACFWQTRCAILAGLGNSRKVGEKSLGLAIGIIWLCLLRWFPISLFFKPNLHQELASESNLCEIRAAQANSIVAVPAFRTQETTRLVYNQLNQGVTFMKWLNRVWKAFFEKELL